MRRYLREEGGDLYDRREKTWIIPHTERDAVRDGKRCVVVNEGRQDERVLPRREIEQ